jgi:hypothetical protein
MQRGQMKFMKTSIFSRRSVFSPLPGQTPANAAKLTPTERIALWPGKTPVGDGKFENCKLEIEVFLPPVDRANGAAICFVLAAVTLRHVTDREGYPIA